jgi:opine dehydrogenase
VNDVVGIIGAGNSARALAAYLSSRGHSVVMYSRTLARADDLLSEKAVRASGMVEGTFPLACVTDDYALVAELASVIFVATTADAYVDVAGKLGHHLHEDRHRVVLFSSKLCGSQVMTRALDAIGKGVVPVIETDALFACRTQLDGTIRILGLKEWTLYSCPRRSDTKVYGPTLLTYFPKLEPASSLIQRGLTDFGALAHALIMTANLSKVDRAEPFLFYYEGLSRSTVPLLERMEDEFRQVAQAYATQLLPMSALLDRYYGCSTSSLYDAMTSVGSYRTIAAPVTLEHRFFDEDIGCTLTPLQDLARTAAIATPLVDAVITIASIVRRRDYRASGRTLTTLGWQDWDRDRIVEWLDS